MSKKNRNAVAVESPASVAVESPASVAVESTTEQPTSVVLTQVESKYKGFATFSVDGHKGKVWFSTSLFDGPVPASITIDGVTLAAPKVPAAKLTPEERKAAAKAAAEARKAETPAQKADRAKAVAQKAAERAAKLAAEAEKLATA